MNYSNTVPFAVLVACLTLIGCENPGRVGSVESLPTVFSAADRQEIRLALDSGRSSIAPNLGFAKAVSAAVIADPQAQAAKQAVFAGGASVREVRSLLKPQISGTLYAGVPDAYVESLGALATLDVSQLIYDGGSTSNQIISVQLAHKAAYEGYRLALNTSALEAVRAWIDLNRYAQLRGQLNSRLLVLNPLIDQLGRVVDAGVGNATSIAAAKRQVTALRIIQTEIEQSHFAAQERFRRIFGRLPSSTGYNAKLFRNAPGRVSDDDILTSPQTVLSFLLYQRSIADLKSVEGQKSVSVGLQAQVVEPADGNAADQEASVGLVIRKTFYDGNRLKARIDQARINSERQRNLLSADYQRGLEAAKATLILIQSMRKSIVLAEEDRKGARTEVDILRQQFSIGQSSLEQVLTAEARLYSAEAARINFHAELDIAQATLLSLLGRLTGLVGIDPVAELLA